MKKIFFALFFASFLFSCEEKDKPTPAPELSSQVAGNYQVTKLKVDGQEMSLNSAEIFVQFEKASTEVVTGVMKVKINGESEPDENIGNINLKNAGSTGIDLYEGTTKVGNVSKSNVLSIFVEFEGQEFEMQADKK